VRLSSTTAPLITAPSCQRSVGRLLDTAEVLSGAMGRGGSSASSTTTDASPCITSIGGVIESASDESPGASSDASLFAPSPQPGVDESALAGQIEPTHRRSDSS
jgi:hypothetical protein